jgi:hypothetical protein
MQSNKTSGSSSSYSSSSSSGSSSSSSSSKPTNVEAVEEKKKKRTSGGFLSSNNLINPDQLKFFRKLLLGVSFFCLIHTVRSAGDSNMAERMVDLFGDQAMEVYSLLKMIIGLVFFHAPCVDEPGDFKAQLIVRLVDKWKLLSRVNLVAILDFGKNRNINIKNLYQKFKDVRLKFLDFFNEEAVYPTYAGFSALGGPMISGIHTCRNELTDSVRLLVSSAMGVVVTQGDSNISLKKASGPVKGPLSYFLMIMAGAGFSAESCRDMTTDQIVEQMITSPISEEHKDKLRKCPLCLYFGLFSRCNVLWSKNGVKKIEDEVVDKNIFFPYWKLSTPRNFKFYFTCEIQSVINMMVMFIVLKKQQVNTEEAMLSMFYDGVYTLCTDLCLLDRARFFNEDEVEHYRMLMVSYVVHSCIFLYYLHNPYTSVIYHSIFINNCL